MRHVCATRRSVCVTSATLPAAGARRVETPIATFKLLTALGSSSSPAVITLACARGFSLTRCVGHHVRRAGKIAKLYLSTAPSILRDGLVALPSGGFAGRNTMSRMIGKPSRSGGEPSTSRVYTDINVQRPAEYSDYEALNVQWGSQDNYSVVRKVRGAGVSMM